MCYFFHAQLFEITHVANIKSTLVQHSCRNAEVVEAFCPVAASRSNTRRSIHQPTVAALHAPAEMPTALSSVPRYAEIHLVSCSRRAHHRERCRHATLIALVAPPVPYLPRLRALALFGRRSVERAEPLSCRRPKTLYGAFLVKGKFPHMLLSCRVLRLVGFSGRSILGMKAPLLGRAERSIPAARKGRAF